MTCEKSFPIFKPQNLHLLQLIKPLPQSIQQMKFVFLF